MFEVEQKFRVGDPAALRQRLSQLGIALDPAEVQADLYLAHPSRDFAATDEAFRIRGVGERYWLTYKGPKIDQTTKTRREIELPLAGGEAAGKAAEECFTALGFRAVATVRKERRRARLPSTAGDVELAWDSIAGLGEFVELELTADRSGLDAARAALAEWAGRLGLETSERRSYLEMLLEAGPR